MYFFPHYTCYVLAQIFAQDSRPVPSCNSINSLSLSVCVSVCVCVSFPKSHAFAAEALWRRKKMAPCRPGRASMRVVVVVSLLMAACLIACTELRHAMADTLPPATQACTLDDVQYVYTECLHHRGNSTTTAPSILGVPFFDPSTCDAGASDSVSLPGIVHTACDFTCEPGFAIGANGTCDPCPRGSYSAGDALDLFAGAPSTFEDMAERGAWTICLYKTSNSKSIDARCSGWTIEDGVLAVGPYDTPNNYYAHQCRSSNVTCVNNVESELRLDVKLVKNGSVVFDYDVDAEEEYDGLRFYVDNFAPDSYNVRTHCYELSFACNPEGFVCMRTDNRGNNAQCSTIAVTDDC